MSQHHDKPLDLQFAINADLCIQCGACAEDCPFHIIDMVEGFPAINAARAHHCIGCQHCLAVCPSGALSILGYNPDNSLPLPQSLPSGVQVAALMRGRRSVRVYDPEPISPQTIAELLAAAANAPTGKNKRQCLFTVIEDRESMDVLRRETIEELRRAVAGKRLSAGLSYFRHVVTAWDQGRDIIFRNAPHLLMVSAPPSITTPDADALIAMTYFELLAAAQGVGTLWNAMIRWAFAVIDVDMYARLGIPEDHFKGYTLLFGRPAVHYHRTVQRDEALINRVSLS